MQIKPVSTLIGVKVFVAKHQFAKFEKRYINKAVSVFTTTYVMMIAV